MDYSIDSISKVINSIFSSLFSSIDNNLYSILDDISFISSDILSDYYFQNILGNSTSNGIILICNSLILGLIIYYSANSLLSYIIYSKSFTHLSFLFRLTIFGIAMNFSPFICSLLLDFVSFISLAIRNIGEVLFNKNICFSSLIQEINSVIYIDSNSLNVFSLDGLIKTFISIGLLNLVFSYSLRYVLVKLLILISPLAFLSLVFEKTTWFFKSWLKAIFSLLFIQIIVALILLLIFSLDLNSSDLFVKILLLGSIYSLIKANNFIKELMGGISTDFSINIQNLIRR